MKAMIFAAGLGTRLKPITDHIPKALVPVAGKPMLERVILKLKAAGFDDIVINIHHFGEQIIDFLQVNNNFGVTIHLSDERDMLLDTGGGIQKARVYFEKSSEPFLVHNVDILSNVDLNDLYNAHLQNKSVATLLVSERKTSRYLLFNKQLKLRGWINKKTSEIKPKGLPYNNDYLEYAFNGIHVLSPDIYRYMDEQWKGAFSIIDFYMDTCQKTDIAGYLKKDLHLLDIGKPETLVEAEQFINNEQL
jgi:MurNAc alpha-1-phosphate uridylyltransferase